jgi:hypothetical protein
MAKPQTLWVFKMKNLVNIAVVNSFIYNLITELNATSSDKFLDPEFLTLWTKAFIMDQYKYQSVNIGFIINPQLPTSFTPPYPGLQFAQFPGVGNQQPYTGPGCYNQGYQNQGHPFAQFPGGGNQQPHTGPGCYNQGYQNQGHPFNYGLNQILDIDGQIDAVVSEIALLLNDKTEDLLANEELLELRLKSSLIKKLEDLDLGKKKLVKQELSKLKQKLLKTGVSIEVMSKYFNTNF